jgi:signal transduction histidine kinase
VESRAERRLTAENARLREALARSVAVVQRANGLASLGLLTAGLAHEIRSPLVALRVFAQLLPERWEDTEFRGEFSSVAVAEVDRVDALVRELLRLAHDAPPLDGSSGGAASDAAPRQAFAEAIAGLIPLLRVQARRKDIELAFERDEADVYVAADPMQVRQVLMNLVLNAIEATPSGGRIAVACSRRSSGASAYAVLSVRDSGHGIDPADLPRVFEPFFTTRGDGTGLGLAITRDIVTGCGGSIVAENARGTGAVFTVELPEAGGDVVAASSAR